jgi:hypothetical protein
MKIKSFFALIALVALTAFTVNAQSPTPLVNGMGVMTPAPTSTPTGVAIGQPTVSKTVHYNVTKTQIAALGAVTAGDITLFNLPSAAVIDQTLTKPFVSVAGTSFSAATARVITANNNYGTAYDVFQAVGNTVSDFDGTHPHLENFVAVTPVLLHMTSTGGNLSATTAGSIDVWITYHRLDAFNAGSSGK